MDLIQLICLFFATLGIGTLIGLHSESLYRWIIVNKVKLRPNLRTLVSLMNQDRKQINSFSIRIHNDYCEIHKIYRDKYPNCFIEARCVPNCIICIREDIEFEEDDDPDDDPIYDN